MRQRSGSGLRQLRKDVRGTLDRHPDRPEGIISPPRGLPHRDALRSQPMHVVPALGPIASLLQGRHDGSRSGLAGAPPDDRRSRSALTSAIGKGG